MGRSPVIEQGSDSPAVQAQPGQAGDSPVQELQEQASADTTDDQEGSGGIQIKEADGVDARRLRRRQTNRMSAIRVKARHEEALTAAVERGDHLRKENQELRQQITQFMASHRELSLSLATWQGRWLGGMQASPQAITASGLLQQQGLQPQAPAGTYLTDLETASGGRST